MTNYQHEDEKAKQQDEELHYHDEITAESAQQDESPEPGARLALEATETDIPPVPVAPVAPSQAEEKAGPALEATENDIPPVPVVHPEAVAPSQPDKAPEPARKEESVELERDLYRGKPRRAEKPLDEKIRRLEDRPETRRPAKEERAYTRQTQRRDDKYRRRSHEPEHWSDEQTKAVGIGLLAVLGVIVLGRQVAVLFELLSNWWALLILVPGIWALDRGYTAYRVTGRLPRLARQWLVGGFIGTLIGLVGLFNMWYLMPLWFILSGAVIWWANKNR